jgi:hypothetical protein
MLHCLACFLTPLELALLQDSRAVESAESGQWEVCRDCVSLQAAAIIEARRPDEHPHDNEPIYVRNVVVLVSSYIGPPLFLAVLPLTDLEQLLLKEVKALREVTGADTQRIRRECAPTDHRTDEDLAAQYDQALDLMPLFRNQAYKYLYGSVYVPGMGWASKDEDDLPASVAAETGAAGAAGGAAGL